METTQDQIEFITTTEHLIAVIEEHGFHPSLMAYADPDGALLKMIPQTAALESWTDVPATEGVLSSIKEFFKNVKKSFLLKFSDFNRESITEQQQALHKKIAGLVSRDPTTTNWYRDLSRSTVDKYSEYGGSDYNGDIDSYTKKEALLVLASVAERYKHADAVLKLGVVDAESIKDAVAIFNKVTDFKSQNYYSVETTPKGRVYYRRHNEATSREMENNPPIVVKYNRNYGGGSLSTNDTFHIPDMGYKTGKDICDLTVAVYKASQPLLQYLEAQKKLGLAYIAKADKAKNSKDQDAALLALHIGYIHWEIITTILKDAIATLQDVADHASALTDRGTYWDGSDHG